jgi:hypothetical protein
VITVVGHVGGMPVEETIGGLGPFLLAAFGAATVRLRAGWLARRSRP